MLAWPSEAVTPVAKPRFASTRLAAATSRFTSSISEFIFRDSLFREFLSSLEKGIRTRRTASMAAIYARLIGLFREYALPVFDTGAAFTARNREQESGFSIWK